MMLNVDIAGFESKPGPKHTLETFKKHADGFAKQYFRSKYKVERDAVKSNQREPSVEEIEGEYNRIVKSPSEEIEVCWNAHNQLSVCYLFQTTA